MKRDGDEKKDSNAKTAAIYLLLVLPVFTASERRSQHRALLFRQTQEPHATACFKILRYARFRGELCAREGQSAVQHGAKRT
jgi:hypothetical protein